MAEVPYYAIKDIPTKRAIQALINEIAGLRKLVAASGGRVVVQEGGGGGGGYELPVAGPNRLGGVKVGANLSITAGGVLSAAGATPYVLPVASADTLGGVKVGSGLAITNGVLSATGGGGGSTVSIELPTGITGTEIARLTIDGTTYSIVAPAGGGGGGGGGGGTNPTQRIGINRHFAYTSTISASISSTIGSLVFAAVSAYAVQTAPSGWTALGSASLPTAGSTRYLTVFYKAATESYTEFEITLTGSNVSIGLVMNNITNGGIPILYQDNSAISKTGSTNSATLVKDTPDAMLWYAVSARISGTAFEWACTDSNVEIEQIGDTSFPVLCSAFDGRTAMGTYTLSMSPANGTYTPSALGIAIPAAS